MTTTTMKTETQKRRKAEEKETREQQSGSGFVDRALLLQLSVNQKTTIGIDPTIQSDIEMHGFVHLCNRRSRRTKRKIRQKKG